MAKPPYTLGDFNLSVLFPQKADYEKPVIGKPDTSIGDFLQQVGDVLNKVSEYYSKLDAEKKYSDFVSKFALLDYQARKEKWDEGRFQKEAEKLFTEYTQGIDSPEDRLKFENFYKLKTTETALRLKEIHFNDLKDNYLASLLETQNNLLQTVSPFDVQTFDNNVATFEAVVKSGVEKGFLNKTTATKYMLEFKKAAFDNFAKISLAIDPARFRKELVAGIYDKYLTPEKKKYYEKLAVQEELYDYRIQKARQEIEEQEQVKSIIEQIHDGKLTLEDVNDLAVSPSVKEKVLSYYNKTVKLNPESLRIFSDVAYKLQRGGFKNFNEFAGFVEDLQKQGKISVAQASKLYSLGLVYFAPEKKVATKVKVISLDKLPLVKDMRNQLKQEIKGNLSYLEDILNAQGLKVNLNPQAAADAAVMLFDKEVLKACLNGQCDTKTLTNIAERVRMQILLPKDKAVFKHYTINPKWGKFLDQLYEKVSEVAPDLNIHENDIPKIVNIAENKFIEDIVLKNPFGFIRLTDIADYYAQDGKTELPPIRIVLRRKLQAPDPGLGLTHEEKSLYIIPYIYPDGTIEWDVRGGK